MITFWFICAILTAIALAFILPPLRHASGVNGPSGFMQPDLDVYRDHFAELESDRRNGVITEEQFQLDREELERRVILDVPEIRAAGTVKPSPITGGPGYVLAIGLPLAAVALYLTLGSPGLL